MTFTRIALAADVVLDAGAANSATDKLCAIAFGVCVGLLSFAVLSNAKKY